MLSLLETASLAPTLQEKVEEIRRKRVQDKKKEANAYKGFLRGGLYGDKVTKDEKLPDKPETNINEEGMD